MNKAFNLSANIENGLPANAQYIVTPNGRNAIQDIINNYRSGIHSFTIIGTYGTGKSSFILALEDDLLGNNQTKKLINPQNLSETESFEILNIVGDYAELSILLGRKLKIDGNSQLYITQYTLLPCIMV